MSTFLAEEVHVEGNENNASALRSTHQWFYLKKVVIMKNCDFI